MVLDTLQYILGTLDMYLNVLCSPNLRISGVEGPASLALSSVMSGAALPVSRPKRSITVSQKVTDSSNIAAPELSSHMQAIEAQRARETAEVPGAVVPRSSASASGIADLSQGNEDGGDAEDEGTQAGTYNAFRNDIFL